MKIKKVYVKAADGLSSKQMASIARSSTDPKELKRLSYDNAESVRTQVLKNKNTPNDVVQRLCKELANSGKADAREAVAKRTDDPQLLAQFAGDDDSGVRATVVQRTDDPELLAQLASDDSWYVRRAVAKRTDDPELLAQLANDDGPGVRAIVARRTDDPELLAQLASDSRWEVRKAVAESTNDPQLLAQLVSDKDSDVRKVARAKLRGDSKSTSRTRSKTPKSDWSVPLYSITDYSQIESEIDQVIDSALQQYGSKYLGSNDVVVNSPDGVYDNGGELSVTFNTPDGNVSTTIDAEDVLGPATSQNQKAKCVKTTLAWLEKNLDV